MNVHLNYIKSTYISQTMRVPAATVLATRGRAAENTKYEDKYMDGSKSQHFLKNIKFYLVFRKHIKTLRDFKPRLLFTVQPLSTKSCVNKLRQHLGAPSITVPKVAGSNRYVNIFMFSKIFCSVLRMEYRPYCNL